MKKLILAIAAVSCAIATAQVPGTGAYKFATLDNRGFDQVNIGNLNVRFTIPVVSKAGRGLPFNYALQYEGLVWQPVNNGTTTTWVPNPNWGFSGTLNGSGVLGTLSYTHTVSVCGTIRGGQKPIPAYAYKSQNYAYHDPFGAVHPFNYSTLSACAATRAPGSTSGDGSSSDGSGYTLINSGSQVRTSNGITISAPISMNGSTPAGSAAQFDANGNQITFNGSGAFTDTTGTTELTISGSNPVQFTYPVTLQANKATSATAGLYYKSYIVRSNFGCSGVVEYGSNAVGLVDHILLADGEQYSFTYEGTPNATDGAVTGRLASVKLPTGGTISYSYYGGPAGVNGITCYDGTGAGLNRTTSDGTRMYQRGGIAGTQTAYITTLTNEANKQSWYHFTVDSLGFYEATRRRVHDGIMSGSNLLEEDITCYNNAAQSGGNCDGQTITQPITEADTSTSFNYVNSPALTKTSFDATGSLVTSIGTYSGPTLLQNTTNTYATSPSGVTEVATTQTKDGSGNSVSYTSYGYDESSATTTHGITQHTTPLASPGNLTSQHVFVDGNPANNSPANLLTTTTTYYDTGAPIATVTPASVAGGTTGSTTYAYDAATQTFVNTATLPTPSSGVTLAASATYDVPSGAVTSTTGMNSGQTTTVTQYDSLLRPLAMTLPNGGTGTFTYTLTGGYIATQTLGNGTSTNVESITDTYGRMSRTAVFNGQTNPGTVWYQTDYCYDATGALQFQSVAYAGSGFAQTQQCSGTGTSYTHDGLGRVVSVSNADGTASYIYNGRATQSKDVSGVQRITQYDLLGRIAAVCEISALTLNNVSPVSCGMDIAGTGFLTTYSYSYSSTAPGPTTTITQGVQTRSFTTDAAGRATKIIEPERGETDYSYASNATGLVVTRNRPKPNQTSSATKVATTTQYDSVGRVLGVTYSDGTPAKQLFYDAPSTYWAQRGSQSYMVGMLSLATRLTPSGGVSTGTLYGYDAMGNVVMNVECQPSGCGNSTYDRTIAYQYDQAGNLTGEGDGSGTNYTYGRSPAGEITSIASSAFNATNPASVVSNVSNTPFGALNYLLGNGLYTVNSYDTSGRKNGTWTCGATSSFGCGGGSTSYGNYVFYDGSRVLYDDDTHVGKQNLGYDDFNRLTSITDASTSKQLYQYTYDVYGNRIQQNALQGGTSYQAIVNAGTNQIKSAGAGGSFTYDAAGNLINDGQHTYTYDADGNLVSLDNGQTSYVYDALNRRVRIQSQAGTSEFVFDNAGRRMSAWDPTSRQLSEAVIYSDSAPVAFRAQGKLWFQHQSVLGTERLRTDYAGNVDGNFSSLAFGDGYASTGDDLDRYHFASLDYDPESTTQHAQFRQYSAAQGRWMSPDPYNGSYNVGNPQSLNRYAYVLNNPLSSMDPLGLDEVIPIDPSGGDGGGVTVIGELPDPVELLPCFSLCWGVGNPPIVAPVPSPTAPTSPVRNPPAPNNPTPKTCIQQSLMATIPGLQDASQTVGAPGPYNGYGHMNEVDTLTFSSPGAQYAFQGSTRLGLLPASVSERGYGPGVRLSNGLHVEFYGFPNGQFAVTSHLDLFNPNNGLGPLLGHFFVDVLYGHIKGKNSGALDKGCPAT